MNTNYPTSSSNYYGLPSHASYVGLPPTQPSPRQGEYFEGKAQQHCIVLQLLMNSIQ
jgi:hypothetical protein